MFLSNPFSGAFGLAIDDVSLTLMQFKRHQHFRKPASFSLEILRSVELPSGAIVNGEIEQPEIVRRKLLHLLGDGKTFKPLDSKWVAANLPESKTFLKLITIPTQDAPLTTELITSQAAKHLPFDSEDTYLDWQVVHKDAITTSILLAAAPKKTADSYTYLLEVAGLNPLALEPEPLAITRALISETTHANEAQALVHLGQTNSSIVIFDKGMLQFSSSIPFSLRTTTSILAKELGVEQAEAARLLQSHGLSTVKENPKYLSTIDKLIVDLLAKIKQTITFYHDHFDDVHPVTNIVLSGSFAELANLNVIFSQKLKISSAAGNAWVNVSDGILDEKIKKHGLSYTIAIGLALRAAQNPLDNPSI